MPNQTSVSTPVKIFLKRRSVFEPGHLCANAIQVTWHFQNTLIFLYQQNRLSIHSLRPKLPHRSITQKQTDSLNSSGAFHMLRNTSVVLTPLLLASRATESLQGTGTPRQKLRSTESTRFCFLFALYIRTDRTKSKCSICRSGLRLPNLCTVKFLSKEF